MSSFHDLELAWSYPCMCRLLTPSGWNNEIYQEHQLRQLKVGYTTTVLIFSHNIVRFQQLSWPTRICCTGFYPGADRYQFGLRNCCATPMTLRTENGPGSYRTASQPMNWCPYWPKNRLKLGNISRKRWTTSTKTPGFWSTIKVYCLKLSQVTSFTDIGGSVYVRLLFIHHQC